MANKRRTEGLVFKELVLPLYALRATIEVSKQTFDIKLLLSKKTPTAPLYGRGFLVV